jgi:hypothetical protein
VAVGDFGCSSPSDPACVENAAGKFVDGNLDIVMGDRGAQSVFIFFGDGRGRFSSPSDVPIGGRAQRLAVADFEQDGDTDIAVTDITGNRTLVLVNNGNSFPQFNVIELPSGDETIAPDDVVAADFNRDGRPDILVLNTGSTRVKDVTLYLFDRTIRDIPVFQRFGNFLVGRNPSDLIIADFDQDGFADDAAMLNRPQRDDVTQVEFLFSRLRDCNVEGRNCTFVAFDPQPPLVLRCPSGNLICRGRAMRAGDFDNDDIVDLAVALSEREGDIHDLAILGGRGNGAYVEDVFFFLDVPGEAMTLGFFDLGPFLDIALAKVRNVRVDLFLNVSGRLPGEDCDEDDQCRSGVCVGGVCCGRDLGDCCEEDTDCESGFCVDGVCCNERCPDGICDVPATDADADHYANLHAKTTRGAVCGRCRLRTRSLLRRRRLLLRSVLPNRPVLRWHWRRLPRLRGPVHSRNAASHTHPHTDANRSTADDCRQPRGWLLDGRRPAAKHGQRRCSGSAASDRAVAAPALAAAARGASYAAGAVC